MAQTIYASFPDATLCEQAAGALLDYGVRKEDISLVAHENLQRDWMSRHGARGVNGANTVAEQGYRGGELRGAGAVLESPVRETQYDDTIASQRLNDQTSALNPTYVAGRTGSQDNLSYADPIVADNTITGASRAEVYDDRAASRDDDNADIEGAAKQGISVTTPGDASAGAAKGAGWGLGLGILAGIASLMIPGVGWVVGGGALATAIGGVLGTTVAGAIAGGVTGYLKDQGVPEEVAVNYNKAIEQGGALLAVQTPSHNVDTVTIEQVLRKYGATNISAY